MSGPVIEHDGLELMLLEIRKNIQDNQQFLKLLKIDRDVPLPDEDSDDRPDSGDGDFEEL